MSEGMWDGGHATICPHGSPLSLGDEATCGCRLRIITKENLVIHPGPYDLSDRFGKVSNRHRENGFPSPEGHFVGIIES